MNVLPRAGRVEERTSRPYAVTPRAGTVHHPIEEAFVEALPPVREPSPLDSVLDYALITAPEARDPAWKLTVDFGPQVGTLQTSAKVTNYQPDELLGRSVVGAGR